LIQNFHHQLCIVYDVSRYYHGIINYEIICWLIAACVLLSSLILACQLQAGTDRTPTPFVVKIPLGYVTLCPLIDCCVCFDLDEATFASQ